MSISALSLAAFLVAISPTSAEESLARPLASNPQPPFPEKAREAEVEGYVDFKVTVSEKGEVESVEVQRVPQEGFGFEDAVQGTLKTWRFEPARADDRAVRGTYQNRIAFFANFPYEHARIYARTSRAVWEAATEVLKETGLSTEVLDQKSQFALTRPKVLIFFKDAPPLDLPAPYRAQSVKLHLFVSPFVEPARVHVGSVVQALYQLETGYGALFYNRGAVESWFFHRLEERLSERGRPMPEGKKRRQELVRSLVPVDAPNSCLDGRPPSGLQQPPKPPEPITGSRIQPIYPGKQQGAVLVKVEALILEDGAVARVRPLDVTGVEPPFVVTATQAVRLWRYKPTLFAGCPTPVRMTVTVNFKRTP